MTHGDKAPKVTKGAGKPGILPQRLPAQLGCAWTSSKQSLELRHPPRNRRLEYPSSCGSQGSGSELGANLGQNSQNPGKRWSSKARQSFDPLARRNTQGGSVLLQLRPRIPLKPLQSRRAGIPALGEHGSTPRPDFQGLSRPWKCLRAHVTAGTLREPRLLHLQLQSLGIIDSLKPWKSSQGKTWTGEPGFGKQSPNSGAHSYSLPPRSRSQLPGDSSWERRPDPFGGWGSLGLATRKVGSRIFPPFCQIPALWRWEGASGGGKGPLDVGRGLWISPHSLQWDEV